MARKVVWTLAALRDLEDTARYLARDSHAYAASFVQEMLRTAGTLNQLAERGRPVPEVGDRRIRELILTPYRMIFCVETRVIGIISVVHGARDLKLKSGSIRRIMRRHLHRPTKSRGRA